MYSTWISMRVLITCLKLIILERDEVDYNIVDYNINLQEEYVYTTALVLSCKDLPFEGSYLY